jgi:YVTN family beta-propeller protein
MPSSAARKPLFKDEAEMRSIEQHQRMPGGGKCMKGWKAFILLAGFAVLSGCGSNGPGIAIMITPTATTVVLSGTQQFTAMVTGNSNTNVNWFVSTPGGTLVSGGNSTLGTISSTGLYTAPSVLPNPAMVIVTAEAAASSGAMAAATVTLDSGVRVTISPTTATIGTGEVFTFSATVTGSINTAVTWAVNGVIGGGSSIGTITTSGVYTAPSTAQTVTITATSVADVTASASATVTVVVPIQPVVTSLDPSTTGQGSALQDVYLAGANFLSTSVALADGNPVPTTFISTTFLLITLPADLLTKAGPLAIVVRSQEGLMSAPILLTVTPVRPAVVSTTPASVPVGSSAVSVNLDGGYFSASTIALFNGQQRGASASNSRQLNVGLAAGDTATPGLYSVVVQNNDVTPPAPSTAAVNLAVQPVASQIPLVPVATVNTGMQPVSVAVNTATGVAVVANKKDSPGTVTLINLLTNTVIGTVRVGAAPTSVSVDNLLNQAAVVNSGDNTISVVDLNTQTVVATIPLPNTTTAYSVGVNPLSHRGLVANQSTNAGTIIDLSTSPPSVVCVVGGNNPPNSCSPGSITQGVNTGVAPSVAIDPRINWAVVTPGGAGSVTIVDLGRAASTGDMGRTPNVVASLTLQPTTQGIAINPETNQALLTDPGNNYFSQFSLLDQTVNTLILDKGEIASAINPLTNMGISVNSLSNQASVINLQNLQLLLQGIQVGTSPASVDVDPVTNEAVVANSGNNSASILSLGPIRPLHLTESSPASTFTSTAPLTLTVVGGGFVSGSVVRLDQTNILPTTVLPPGCTANCRELTATVSASLLGAPRRYVVDVQNPDTTVTNATDLTVMASVPVGNSPGAVAIDPDREIAVVTNVADGTVNLVDLATDSASAPIIVGSQPEGAAVLPRLGRAVITNFGSNTISIVDLTQNLVIATIGVGTAPLGVSINPQTAEAVVANTASNSVSFVDLNTGQNIGGLPVDTYPAAVAIDPALNYAAVTAATENTVVLLNLTTNTIVGRISSQELPTGAVFDPISGMFIVADSLENNLTLISPQTLQTTNVRTGINPVSLDYNFQTSTLVTANNVSNTLSVMDFLNQTVQAILPIANSAMFSVAIDPLTNLAVVADQANNRVVIVPLPH